LCEHERTEDKAANQSEYRTNESFHFRQLPGVGLRRIRQSLASIDAGGTIIVAERVANRQGFVANLGALSLFAQRAMILFRPAILGKLNNV